MPFQEQAAVVEWKKKERARYVADLGVTGPPHAGAVQQFLEDALARARMPGNWVLARDDSQRIYFANAKTHESSWTHPLESALLVLAETCRKCLDIAEGNRDGWIRHVHAGWKADGEAALAKWKSYQAPNGETYYYNESTQETVWEHPSEREYPSYQFMLEALGTLTDVNYVRQLLRLQAATHPSVPAASQETSDKSESAAGGNQAEESLFDVLQVGRPAEGRSGRDGKTRKDEEEQVEDESLSDIVKVTRDSHSRRDRNKKAAGAERQNCLLNCVDAPGSAVFDAHRSDQIAKQPPETGVEESLLDVFDIASSSDCGSERFKKGKKHKKDKLKAGQSREHHHASSSNTPLDASMNMATKPMSSAGSASLGLQTGIFGIERDSPAKVAEHPPMHSHSQKEWTAEIVQLQKELCEVELQRDLSELKGQEEVAMLEMCSRQKAEEEQQSLLRVRERAEEEQRSLLRVREMVEEERQCLVRIRQHEATEAERHAASLQLCRTLELEQEAETEAQSKTEIALARLDGELLEAKQELDQECAKTVTLQSEWEGRQKRLQAELRAANDAKNTEVKELRKQRRTWQFKHTEDGAAKAERDKRIEELTSKLQDYHAEFSQMSEQLAQSRADVVVREHNIEELSAAGELQEGKMLQMSSELNELTSRTGKRSGADGETVTDAVFVEELRSTIHKLQTEVSQAAAVPEDAACAEGMMEGPTSEMRAMERELSKLRFQVDDQSRSAAKVTSQRLHQVEVYQSTIQELQAEVMAAEATSCENQLFDAQRRRTDDALRTGTIPHLPRSADMLGGSQVVEHTAGVARCGAVLRGEICSESSEAAAAQRDEIWVGGSDPAPSRGAVSADTRHHVDASGDGRLPQLSLDNGDSCANSRAAVWGNALGACIEDSAAAATNLRDDQGDVQNTVTRRLASPGTLDTVAGRQHLSASDRQLRRYRQGSPTRRVRDVHCTQALVKKKEADIRAPQTHSRQTCGRQPQQHVHSGHQARPPQSRRTRSTSSLVSSNVQRLVGQSKSVPIDRSSSQSKTEENLRPRHCRAARSSLAIYVAATPQDLLTMHPTPGSDPGLETRQAALMRVKADGQALRRMPLEIRADREVVLAAVKCDGLALSYAAAHLRKDSGIVRAAVQSNGLALASAAPELQGDPQIVAQAVQSHGLALHYATEEIRGLPDVVRTAVESHGLALQYASDHLRADRAIVLAAVRSHSVAIVYAAPELRQDPELVCDTSAANKESLAIGWKPDGSSKAGVLVSCQGHLVDSASAPLLHVSAKPKSSPPAYHDRDLCLPGAISPYLGSLEKRPGRRKLRPAWTPLIADWSHQAP